MAHYARLDNNNVVVAVFVGRDEEPGVDWESHYGAKRCSYNTRGGVNSRGATPLRKNFPGVGWTYDPARDAFVPPRPQGGQWRLDEGTCQWSSVSPPSGG